MDCLNMELLIYDGIFNVWDFYYMKIFSVPVELTVFLRPQSTLHFISPSP